ncbi:MAG: spondin domain-containing protein [Gammaproteobacteria bacterium]|nr:spondin domain-containing protein [Gammaproteobacteria bacterium]
MIRLRGGASLPIRCPSLAAMLAVAATGSATEVVENVPGESADQGDDARIETSLDPGVYYLLLGRHERHKYRAPASDDAEGPCPCEDTDDEGEDTAEKGAPLTARYSVTFTALWTAADHGPVPSGAHFTTLAGAAVNADAGLWTPGELASPGLERLAELGQTSTFLTEVAAATEVGDAGEGVTSPGTGAVGTSVFEVAVGRDLSSFTFASMIAPSPDWFVGLSEFSLLDDEGRWVEDTGDVGLSAWDAGTETGNRFSLDGRATDPPQPIRLLTIAVDNGVEFDDGTVNGNYLATIRFRRIP